MSRDFITVPAVNRLPIFRAILPNSYWGEFLYNTSAKIKSSIRFVDFFFIRALNLLKKFNKSRLENEQQTRVVRYNKMRCTWALLLSTDVCFVPVAVNVASAFCRCCSRCCKLRSILKTGLALLVLLFLSSLFFVRHTCRNICKSFSSQFRNEFC